MSADSIRLINAAISRTNGNTITSVDDGTPEAIWADLNYEQMVETALCENRWKFARKTADCALLPDAPDSDTYGYAWELPDDLIALRTVTLVGQPIDYVIQESGVIWTQNSDVPQAVYTYRAAEDLWPADFTEGLVLRMEAAILRLDERTTEADSRETAGEKRMAKARLYHSQEEATHEHKKYPLIMARRTGYASCRR